MGKKGRRTRWRTLTIADEHSDSEESNTTTSGHRVPKGYPHKSYYSRFTYSSQSTPTRRYQCDGTKSTRSSSTASENKITFNEDEYTRITTPRQDVLFKKGYLNKPKTYQTQTSTGNSTTSTGNSTGNGTPDHQSTDLEYESQFVFPNGFVDQNGIYYVNSFEPYPVMVYNPPTYYPEYGSVKSKRCSTGSLTESTSPNNEETSQDLSQSETPSNVSDVNHMYNVVYPGYYYNGACQPQEEFVNPEPTCEPEPRRVKKRRRRKLSRSKQEVTTTSESSDEVVSDEEGEEEKEEKEETKSEVPETAQAAVAEEVEEEKNEEEEEKREGEEKEEEEEEKRGDPIPEVTAEPAEEAQEETAQKEEEKEEIVKKYDLKPDAEEFVPRAYRHPETIPIEPNVQFIKLPPNFVPVPILSPMGEFNAFIPPGIPINFVPQNFVNFVPYKPNVHPTDENPEKNEEEEGEEEEEESRETVEVPKNQIDIAKIVSKLEEAAKEQQEVKEETQTKNVTKKRHKFQKVELRKPPEKQAEKESKKSPKKEDPVIKPARNYSETLKKSIGQTCERHERNMERKVARNPVKESPVKTHHRVEKAQPKVSNEWIAVSSRKKRKNKNVEESEDFVEEKTETVEEVAVPEKPEEMVQELPQPEIVEEIKPLIEEIKEEKKTKKKSKKNHAKVAPPPITRRIIITDVDLSVEEAIEDVKDVEESKPTEEEKEEEKIVEKEEEKVVEVEAEKKETEKKSKKKKKKLPKILSHSSSNPALNVTEDSYDFLLDESLDKTNVEISQELDKMIQRGMYSSLEEKIKSMNIESNDNFFKTIISNISSRESSVEKSNPYIKPPNLGKLVTTPPVMKPRPKPGDFLSEPTTPEPVGGGDSAPSDALYPITKAVKEWMTKTRETTPDVELLKSPSAIFREFGLDEEAEEGSVVGVVPVEEAVEAHEKEEESVEAEAEEVKNYPKHGNLPYRAICCSIM